ncbi:nucleotide pyrophosphatase [Halostella sp. JP-L12]|uniref:alkaline phosphatase family protein n=1 Tax=Halostella TaxID=1843185 RepID=UPI000EF8132D|nr:MULTISPECIES: alkaline phosphatase family protein [Halostella]NHN46964.1 nucleotide pyrophosphatase [Halostella sp. JP-L12]
MTTVVLGWDALDYELAEQFGTKEKFGKYNKCIDTFDNDVIGKPHTAELWPSIITGVGPETHGIYATSEGSADWENPVVQTAANAAEHIIPDRLRTSIGALLRAHGAEMRYPGPDYYDEEGVDTVFDGRRSLPIAIPNYRVDTDHRFGVLTDRGAQFAEYVDFDTSGEAGKWHEPGIPDHEFAELVTGKAVEKLGIVREAVQRDYDLVFVWLAYLDTVGHLDPVMREHGYQKRAYRQAASWTEEVRSLLQPEDTLVCVSDHGLRKGYHTHDAYLGASEEEAIEDVETVLDVRNGVERVTNRSNTDSSPQIRPAYQQDPDRNHRDPESVREQLSELGYI